MRERTLRKANQRQSRTGPFLCQHGTLQVTWHRWLTDTTMTVQIYTIHVNDLFQGENDEFHRKVTSLHPWLYRGKCKCWDRKWAWRICSYRCSSGSTLDTGGCHFHRLLKWSLVNSKTNMNDTRLSVIITQTDTNRTHCYHLKSALTCTSKHPQPIVN